MNINLTASVHTSVVEFCIVYVVKLTNVRPVLGRAGVTRGRSEVALCVHLLARLSTSGPTKPDAVVPRPTGLQTQRSADGGAGALLDSQASTFIIERVKARDIREKNGAQNLCARTTVWGRRRHCCSARNLRGSECVQRATGKHE